MTTISTHNGSSVSKKHNERDYDVCIKEKHIDLNRTHENWINEGHIEAYERIFGNAVKAYNLKQKREDRKINSYYDKIKNDKQKHCVYEMIIGVYDDNIDNIIKRDILKEFVDNWKERNPNLELIGAYYHDDEEGSSPHVHIDYIPVAYKNKRGLSVQNSLSKALVEQGFKSSSINKTAQIEWERRENSYLEKLCNSRNITVERDLIKREHVDTVVYKEAAERVIQQEKAVIKTLDDLTLSKNDEFGNALSDEIDYPKIYEIPFYGKLVKKEDYDKLNNKHNALVKKVKSFLREADFLSIDMKNENEALTALVDTLKRSRISVRVKKLEDTVNRLKKSKDALERELNRKLEVYKSKYYNLLEQTSDMRKRFNDYVDAYSQEKRKNDLLTIEYNKLQQTNVCIEDYNALERQNTRLKEQIDELSNANLNLTNHLEYNLNYTFNDIDNIVNSKEDKEDYIKDDWDISDDFGF